MLQILRKPSGNISIAMLLMVLGMMSGFTMGSMALRDVTAFQYDFENIQTMLLLRSEAYRGQAIAQKIGAILVPIQTSERRVEIENSAMKKTFYIKSLISAGGLETISDEVVMGDQRQITEVHSRVKSKAGIGQVAFSNPKNSIIRRYGKYTLESETFAKFMYFTDTDESMNATNVYFHGPDLVYGRVHSNSAIWIKKTTGGNNSGWPTFMGWVSTSDQVNSHSGTYPENEVFQGGLSEGYPYVVFPEEASRIRRNGSVVGPIYEDPDHIVMVEVDGPGFTSMLGTVLDPRREFADVHNPYPPVDPATYQYRNSYTVTDTTWAFLTSGSNVNASKFVKSKLWIRGTFGSYQTWGCADTMYLTGDILLSNTTKGSDPITNRTDVVGLVSEKSIVVKYGYRDPVDSLRYYRCIGTDSGFGGIWIYAAMCALGNGHGDPRKDGLFTFEYQHPHPSTPDIRVGQVVYTRLDLHRRRFPQSPSNPWPPNLDYPWYNPLWPERQPYLERGYISVYGSISQRRRGFVHRSYLDGEWPSNGIWNQPLDYCGGTSAPTNVITDPVFGFQMATRDYPGASGGGVGYKKNYHYDTRFYKTSPIDFPEVNRKDETPFAGVGWVLKSPRDLPSNLL